LGPVRYSTPAHLTKAEVDELTRAAASCEDTEYLKQINVQLSYLYGFARQMNELDFAVSLSGEFRGSQDPGWATMISLCSHCNSVLNECDTGPNEGSM
jgi:hypothetical protein